MLLMLVHWNAFSKNIPENRIAWGNFKVNFNIFGRIKSLKMKFSHLYFFLQIKVDFPVSCARKVQFLFGKVSLYT